MLFIATSAPYSAGVGVGVGIAGGVGTVTLMSVTSGFGESV